jgi:hypothetical protein
MRTVIVTFFGYLNNRIRRHWNISKLAKRRNLNISNQDEVGDYSIALDNKKRKLLYAKTCPDVSSCLLIDLNDLEACSIKKEYNSINAGELKTKQLHNFLRSVYLNLAFKNEPGIVSLTLFDARNEHQGDIEQVEAQARKWERIVSKSLPLRLKSIG